MDHTHIIQAGDLSRYADTRDSQGVIPELICRLIRQSVPNASVFRMPYGDDINQSGMDGIVECKDGYPPFVPDGKSCWEIGTGTNPQAKASKDFLNRTKKLSVSERAESSFVFVTPRSAGANGWEEPKQTAWKKRRQNRGWKKIQIIDGGILVYWLKEFPALGRWMATKMGTTLSLGGIITPTEHWDLIRSLGEKGDPPLPPELFTTSRDAACNALEAVFAGESQRLLLFSESEHDVDDFVAACLKTLEQTKSQEYADRCLFISDENAWRTISELRQLHILIANPRLGLDSELQDLQTIATRKGHGVVIPLCEALSGNNPKIIKLRSPSESQIVAVLKDAGFSEVRARELGGIGGERISALRRDLLGLGSVPPYATWKTARQLAQAGLAGQWNANAPADVQAMEKLLGKEYGEWIETLRDDALRSDSPLVQTDEKWKFVVRGEAWSALGNRITDADLDRLEETAVQVLGECDPQFDLPIEERPTASIHGKTLKHSSHIRKGLAETLALLGCRPKALSSCTLMKPETTALVVVRKLLSEATWERWASLDSHLPLLAEAAPNEFLATVESALKNPDDTPFHKIFAQEGGGVLGGGHYMIGLLWALETLAWFPDYLSRVSRILSNIASFDPGGNWANRPANSLVDIFLPWHVQTTAPFDKRKAAIKTVIREQPKIGWALLLALLPHGHSATSGCHRPTWQEYIPRDWKEGVTTGEYWEQITVLTELAVELAKKDAEKLVELVDRLPDFPESAREAIFEYFSSESIIELPDNKRLPIWEKLNELVRRHRRFSDANWAFPEETVAKIEGVASLLSNFTSEFKCRHLFSGRDFELYDRNEDYDEQEKRLDEQRQAAVSDILDRGNVNTCFEFAKTVGSPDEVGRALGVVASNEVEDAILPSLLDSDDDTLARVVAGFTCVRFYNLKTEWVDVVLQKDWTPEHKAKFLTLLPFKEEIWKRVSFHLQDVHEGLYWRNVRVNLYPPNRDLTVAINKLLKHGREDAAVACVAYTVNDESRFDETLAIRTLIAFLNSNSGIGELDEYRTIKLIKHLQKSKTADESALFKIEFNFLPWLGQFSDGSPVTLEKRLASDPAFFAEVVRLIFRSKNEDNDNIEEPDDQKQHLMRNAYTLLTEWKRCPGMQNDGTLDADAFGEWIKEARRITEKTGHAEVAQIQIGHVLTCAPPDQSGLWIHESVAKILNLQGTGEMRSGFTIALFNQRGAYGFTHGQEERKLASENREKADALDSKGYTWFATAMRDLAEQYDRHAERDEKRDPFDV